MIRSRSQKAVEKRVSAQELVTGGQGFPEILQAIFEHAVLDWESSDFSQYTELWTLLHSITLVSRPWARLAYTCPRIWRNLWSGDLDVEAMNNRARFEEFRNIGVPETIFDSEDCLERARAVPLHLHGMGVSYVSSLLYALDSEQLEQVEEIYIRSELLDWTRDAGHLRGGLDVVLPRLSTLTILYGEQACRSSFLGLVGKFVSLRSLTLARVEFELDVLVPHAIAFPALEYFHLATIEPSDIAFFLRSMSAPKLRTLRLFLHHQPFEPRVMDDHEILIPQSGASSSTWDHVRVLALGGDFRRNELQGIMRLVSNAEVYDGHMLLDRFFSLSVGIVEMLNVQDYDPLLPRLSILHLPSVNWDRKDHGLSSLVRSRRASDGVSPLAEIGIPQEYVGHVWKKLRDAGLAKRLKIVEWSPQPYVGELQRPPR